MKAKSLCICNLKKPFDLSLCLSLQPTIHLYTRGTVGWVGLFIRCLHPAQLHRHAVRQLVHGTRCNVEAARCGINCRNVDGVLFILQLVAFSAVGAVPAGDCGGATDASEAGHAAKGRPLGHKAVDAVGAGNVVHRGTGIVIARVVGHGDRNRISGLVLWRRGRESGGDEEGDERDGCGELHFERTGGFVKGRVLIEKLENGWMDALVLLFPRLWYLGS